MIEVNEENYFDIVEVLHSLLTQWHDGRRGYEILCKSQFRPGMGWSESDVEEYECYQDVKDLIENDKGEFLGYDEIEKLMDNLNEFIDNKENEYE